MANQYDETKKMLNKLRSLSNKKYIKEQSDIERETSDMKNDITVINDVDVKIYSDDKTDLQFDDEQEQLISKTIDSLRNEVSRIVNLDTGFLVKPNEIRLDGNLENNKIIFTLIAGENEGVFINMNMTELSKEIIETLDKLKTYYDNVFKNNMEQLINNLNTNI
jgi:hypothetical protein